VARELTRIGVIGLGAMGAGIAQLAIEAGLDSELRDPGAHGAEPHHSDPLDRTRHGHDARWSI